MTIEEITKALDEAGVALPKEGSGKDGAVLKEDLQALLDRVQNGPSDEDLDDGPNRDERGVYRPATYRTLRGNVRRDL